MFSYHPSPHIVIPFFFLVMRTFEIYSLSNFQIYSAVLMAIVIMLYIPSPSDNFKLSLKPQIGSHVRNPS